SAFYQPGCRCRHRFFLPSVSRSLSRLSPRPSAVKLYCAEIFLHTCRSYSKTIGLITQVFMQTVISLYQHAMAKSQHLSGLAPLLLRLYLAPVLLQAGWNKYQHIDDTIAWFGNTESGLGLPVPALMAALAIAAEVLGAVLLLLGLFTRLVSIPLMITMLVAIFAVHWPNGWLA